MKILAIGSHPDDMEFGCGGTLLKYARAGCQIHMLVITSGEIGGDSKIRRAEQERSSKILKARLHWGGFRDTDIPLTRELIQVIEKQVRDIQPTLIFTHYHDDTHQDHRKVSQATTTATRYSRNVLFFEVPSTLNFNPSVYMDVGATIEKKLQLLRCHASQVGNTRIKDLSILESAKATAIFRGYQDRVKFAEAFSPVRLSLDFSD